MRESGDKKLQGKKPLCFLTTWIKFDWNNNEI